MGKMGGKVLLLWIVCLPGLLSATCSSEDSNPINSNDFLASATRLSSTCINGLCSPDGTCVCNPCWSGSTCQKYVDRFAPRFLAEEPFFMVTVSSGEGREVPLFRIESADDDLGLTCQLGQVGPAATCPCATPRYKVVGPSQAVFRADQETGDVFIKHGFSLQPGKHYLITLQVSALEVNTSGYHPWKEEVTSTLYVKRSGGRKPGHSQHFVPETQGKSHSKQSMDFPYKSTPSASASTPSPLTQLRSLWVPSGKLLPELPSPDELNAFKSRSKRQVNGRRGN